MIISFKSVDYQLQEGVYPFKLNYEVKRKEN